MSAPVLCLPTNHRSKQLQSAIAYPISQQRHCSDRSQQRDFNFRSQQRYYNDRLQQRHCLSQIIAKALQSQIIAKTLQSQIITKTLQLQIIAKTLQLQIIAKTWQSQIITKRLQLQIIIKILQRQARTFFDEFCSMLNSPNVELRLEANRIKTFFPSEKPQMMLLELFLCGVGGTQLRRNLALTNKVALEMVHSTCPCWAALLNQSIYTLAHLLYPKIAVLLGCYC